MSPRASARDVDLVRVDDDRVSPFEGEDLVSDQKEPGAVEAVADFEQVVDMRTDVGVLVPRVEVRNAHRELVVHRNPLKLLGPVRIVFS